MARPQRAGSFSKVKTVAENRKARYEYAIEDVFEAGIALTGTEVKSLRFGEGTIAESYAEVKGNEGWLINSNIPEFSHGNRHNHDNLPIILAGGGGGTIKTGRHIAFPEETPMNNLYLSMLDRMGIPTESLGDSTGKLEHLSGI